MKKIFGLIGCFWLAFIFWATISAGMENIKIELRVNDFIKDAILDETESTAEHKIYKIKSDFKLDAPTYKKTGNRYYPGSGGDILLTKTTGTTLPIIQQGIEYYVGGHAGICAFPYEDNNLILNENYTLETTGFGSDVTVKPYSKSSWFNSSYYEIMAVRVKTSLNNRFKAFNKAVSYVGEPYNYSFIFNQNHSKYCSDLVSQSYDYVDINLDYDGLATTVLDIMVSEQVYLTYYSKVDANGIRHTYLLE